MKPVSSPNSLQHHAGLTSGPVGHQLLKMAGSMLIGFIAGAAFNLTDTYFVSRLGTNELAAMGFTLPVTMVIFGLSMGIGIGTTSVLSRTIGQGDHHQVRRLTVDALLLAILLVGILIGIGLLTMKPLFIALGANEQTLPLVMDYMRIWYIGIAFLVIPIVGNNAIRATGDTLSPSVIMVLDLGLNIILDPVLIFGWGPIPAMGIKGAALATVFCRALALMASLYILGYRKRMLIREIPTLSELWTSWRQILYIGIPSTCAHILMPVVMGLIIRMVSIYGTAAVAGLNAGMQVERAAVIPIMALGASLVPFIGQNWGATLYGRVRDAQGYAHKAAFIWGAVCLIAIAGAAGVIAPIFSRDNQVHYYLIRYLWIMPIVFGFRGLTQCANAAMNAINHPYHSSAHIGIRLFVLQLPLATLGSWWYGYTGLLWGLVLAEVIAGILATQWINALYRHKIENTSESQPSLNNGVQSCSQTSEVVQLNPAD